ncbi:MAG: aspartyl protease family protein, partial [Alistipes sp.]|nr:aspartyl protease family protein [Alistipes sp.]
MLLGIDVRIDGRTAPFIIDTGCAEMSFASEEFAKEHNIRPLDYELALSGVGGSQQSRLGVADSLQIGPMTLYNAVFVISDAPMFGSSDRVDAVLGCNFLFEAGIVEVLGAQRLLRFPAEDEPADQGFPNMYMDNNGLCYIRAEADGHPVRMQFDSGNTKSTLSDVYFDKYREEIEAAATEQEFRTGGIGGTQESRAYVKPAVAIGIDGIRCPLYGVEITYATQLAHETGEDGSLGADFLLACDRVRIDYKAMRITLSGKDIQKMLHTTPQPAHAIPPYEQRSTSVWQSKNRRAAININVGPATR